MKAGKAGLKWRDVIFLAVGLALAIAGFGAYHTTQGAAIADGTEAAAKHDAPILAAEPIVEASPSAQKASGIETAPISPKRVQPTTHVYADVPDLQSLFDLRNKWASGKADLNAAQAQYAIAQAQYRRNTVLFDGKHTVSEQTLQDSRAAMLTSILVHRYHAKRRFLGGSASPTSKCRPLSYLMLRDGAPTRTTILPADPS